MQMKQNKRPPIPPDVTLSDLVTEFQDLCFAMQVIQFPSDDITDLIFYSNPDERASASQLRRHTYLKLPDDWRFQSFSG
jgi:hypothetical protein